MSQTSQSNQGGRHLKPSGSTSSRSGQTSRPAAKTTARRPAIANASERTRQAQQGSATGQGPGRRPPDRNGARRARRARPYQVAGTILAVLLIGITIYFCTRIQTLGVLPNNYRNILFIALAVIDLILLLLQRRRARAIPSKVVCVLLIVILLIGSIYLNTAVSTLDSVSDVSTKVNCVAVYVLSDDAAQSIQDAVSYSFGRLDVLDQDNTDQCLTAIQDETGAILSTSGYASVSELANALLNQQIQAAVLNTAYVGLLDDDESTLAFTDRTKIIYEYTYEQEITTPTVTVNSIFNDLLKSTSDEESSEDDDDESGFSITRDPFAIYISGNDSYGSLSSSGRSDVNILAVVNPSTKEIVLVNTPRDYYISLSFTSQKDKLTHAGIYGVDESMNALANLYGIPIRYYARLNFTGFINIVDALGGITVNSTYSFSSSISGYSFSAGENYLNGEAALYFARERKAFSQGDRQRGENQMLVIKAVINKAMSTAILTNYMDVMNAASSAFATNMTQDEIAELVQMQLEDGGDWGITTCSVTGSDSTNYCYSSGSSAYVMVPDESSVNDAINTIASILDDEE